MKKLAVSATAVAALALAGWLARDALLEKAIVARMDETLTRVDHSLLTDGALHVFLCGTAAALPDEKRAGPCTAILAGGEFILVDAGPASWRNVDLLNLPVGKLSAVLVTHLHSDHIGDLGEAATQSWIAGRARPLDIYGPPGIEQVASGLRQVYAADVRYRIAHHGADYLMPTGAELADHAIPMPKGDAAVAVFERNGVKVSAFRVQHAPVDVALGYRIDYAGGSVVITGDTAKTDSVSANARGADLLLHEALAMHMVERASARAGELGLARTAKLAGDVLDYHTSPAQAADIAQAAGVRKLVLTHIFPPLPNRLAEHLFVEGAAEKFSGEIVLGEDGMRFDLPALP